MPPCLTLSTDQLKQLLYWWGGGQASSGEGGKTSSRKEPQIEGLTGKMSFASQAKVEWTKAVLRQAEPDSTHAPAAASGSSCAKSCHQQLRRCCRSWLAREVASLERSDSW